MGRNTLHLRQDTFDRAVSRGVRFKHHYVSYESLGFDRASGQYLCVRIEGKGVRSEPIPFQLLTTRQPRRIHEDWRLIKPTRN